MKGWNFIYSSCLKLPAFTYKNKMEYIMLYSNVRYKTDLKLEAYLYCICLCNEDFEK